VAAPTLGPSATSPQTSKKTKTMRPLIIVSSSCLCRAAFPGILVENRCGGSVMQAKRGAWQLFPETRVCWVYE